MSHELTIERNGEKFHLKGFDGNGEPIYRPDRGPDTKPEPKPKPDKVMTRSEAAELTRTDPALMMARMTGGGWSVRDD